MIMYARVAGGHLTGGGGWHCHEQVPARVRHDRGGGEPRRQRRARARRHAQIQIRLHCPLLERNDVMPTPPKKLFISVSRVDHCG